MDTSSLKKKNFEKGCGVLYFIDSFDLFSNIAPDYSALLGEDDDRESGEEDSDEEQQINKYKKLLQDIDKDNDKSERDVQMEITWGTGILNDFVLIYVTYVTIVQKEANTYCKIMIIFEKLSWIFFQLDFKIMYQSK